MARKAISKGTRFEVFKRDGFTCRYCGAQPPAVVLVIDHIDPVANGGDSKMLNLVTSCEACNQGKGKKLLGDVAPRPDADELYLEAQQEAAEIRRFNDAEEVLQDELLKATEVMKRIWGNCTDNTWPTPLPDATLYILIRRFGVEWVADAIVSTAPRYADGRLPRHAIVPYLWGTLRTMARNATAKEESDGVD